MTTHIQNQPSTPSTATKPAWYRRTWLLVTAGVLFGLMLGSAASGSADPTTSSAYKGVVKERDDTRQQLEETSSSLAAAEAEIESIAGDLPVREEALAEAQAKLEKAQAKLDDAEKALDKRIDAVNAQKKSVEKREKAVGIVEREIEANTISGDGVYEVGVDIKAGTYKSSGGSGMCYYASNGDANGSNILSNNIVDAGAPAIATVAAGTFFETSGCGDWVLQ